MRYLRRGASPELDPGVPNHSGRTYKPAHFSPGFRSLQHYPSPKNYDYLSNIFNHLSLLNKVNFERFALIQMLLHNLLGVIGILVFLTNASPLDSPNGLEKRVIATGSCTQDSYYSTVHSSCYSSSFTVFCSSFLRSTVTGAPTTT